MKPPWRKSDIEIAHVWRGDLQEMKQMEVERSLHLWIVTVDLEARSSPKPRPGSFVLVKKRRKAWSS